MTATSTAPDVTERTGSVLGHTMKKERPAPVQRTGLKRNAAGHDLGTVDLEPTVFGLTPNRAVPVTVLKVAPVRVVQVKTPESDGYAALQVTWGFRRNSTLSKPQLGHYEKAGVNPGRKLVELRLDDVADYTVGQELAADVLEAGERVDAISVSKGKGFAGGMKRHNFKGQGGAHGNHGHHRAPGSIGACATPSRVFKGTRDGVAQAPMEPGARWWPWLPCAPP